VIATTKTSKITQLSGLRYTGAKFGKKMFEDADGTGYFFEVVPSLNEEYLVPIKQVKKEQYQVKPTEEDAIIEESIMKGDKQIRISRLDLDFDDN